MDDILAVILTLLSGEAQSGETTEAVKEAQEPVVRFNVGAAATMVSKLRKCDSVPLSDS